MTDPQPPPGQAHQPLRLPVVFDLMFTLCIGVIAFETITDGPGSKPTWYWLFKAGALILCFVLCVRWVLVHRRDPR